MGLGSALRLKIKLKGSQFNTNEVIDAELQVVINTLKEYGFQAPLKKQQKSCKRRIRVKRTTSRVMVSNRPKVSFRRDDSTSPGNY
jgi:hypothetical protein